MAPKEHLNQVISDIKKDVKVRIINVREICRVARDTLEPMDPSLKVTIDLGQMDGLDIERVTDFGWAGDEDVYLCMTCKHRDAFYEIKDVPVKKMSKADIDAYLIEFFNDKRVTDLFTILEAK